MEVFFEGEQGHSGNVLATTFIAKFHRLLKVMHRLERLHSGVRSRQTEYEIVEAKKFNPTVLALKPVPKVKNYNPMEAFDWSIDQFEAVSRDQTIDARVDVATLIEIADIATPPKDAAYSRLWVRSGAVTVHFDEGLSMRARQAANRLQAIEATTVWYEGVTQGEIVGDLRAVLDEEGEQEFVIHPAVGPERIVCRFPDEKRDEMRNFLFKVVTVKGKLHYKKDSPHPVLVEMEGIFEKPAKVETLYDLRGLFRGMERPAQPEQLW
jgi:hypothetical protein